MYALETENLKAHTETGRLYQLATELEKHANYDILTGLPNRRFFFERLEQMITESENKSSKAAILYIDLDAFKDINDTYGHKIGDGVLMTVGNRLLQCIQEPDIAARLGGDEFAVLIQNIENISNAEKLANKIHKLLEEYMVIENITYTISSSIGIAVYPEAGKDGETLLRNADSAMYEIKRSGKGQIGIYRDHLM